MSRAIGYDNTWKRHIGYGVPAMCDHPGCAAIIDRGLTFVCGGQPYGGEFGCGLYFCSTHQRIAGAKREHAPLCTRCYGGWSSFEPTDDLLEWKAWKLADESWERWRLENPDAVKELEGALP
jgi:hypothetical protein